MGVALADSLRFLAETAKLALELVARGRVLPGLVRRENEWSACWRTITFGPWTHSHRGRAYYWLR